MASIDNVEDVTPLVQYVATAGQTEFDFPFPIMENEDIVVVINGVQKTLTTDYSVSGAGEDTGGSVTLVSALDGGEIVTIYRDILIERSSDFQQNGPLTSAAFNDELDKIILILQQLERDAQRAIRFPLTNPQASSELELSPIDNWENRYLYINADGELEPAAALTATTLSQSVIGSLLHPRTPAEIAAGVTPVDYSIPSHTGSAVIRPERYGLSTSDATGSTNRAAITAAIAVARQLSGGTVLLPSGEFKIDDKILLYDGVWLVGQGGAGNSTTGTSIRYIGSTFQDVIATADASQDDNIKLIGLSIYGGPFQQGRARYGFYAEEFHRRCEVRDVLIRDCLGLIKIVSGYYSTVHDSIFRRVTPSQTAAGVTDEQFAEVYGATSAPVYLGEMNGSDCSHLTMDTIVSQHNTADQPEQAVYVWGTPINCRNWIIETTGVDYTSGASYSPRVNYMIHNYGNADFSGLYVEDVDVELYLIRTGGEALTRLNDFFIYRTAGQTAFYNDAMGDFIVDNGTVYRANYDRAWHATSSGISAGGTVEIGENVHWRAGERLTDVGVNADAGNVFDTADTDYPYGAVDGTVNRFHNQRVCFPRVVTGLTVSSGSDASGPYIQVTGGVLLSEQGKYVNTKFRTNVFPTSVNQSVQRLRPNKASTYYRVYVGRAGNVYLVESATPFTDPVGDWLSSFDTDGSGAIQNLAANERLSRRGNYVTGTSTSVVTGTAAPSTGTWNRGDQVINTTPSAGGAPGWVCVTAGTPGTWKAMANVAA